MGEKSEVIMNGECKPAKDGDVGSDLIMFTGGCEKRTTMKETDEPTKMPTMKRTEETTATPCSQLEGDHLIATLMATSDKDSVHIAHDCDSLIGETIGDMMDMMIELPMHPCDVTLYEVLMTQGVSADTMERLMGSAD